ncbi:hypothetical protein CYMTET_49395 [Cymbomonas tetramitiformis]|uniref:F-box domain-containing protein n=1 Tax=Cymbomonas tetramitiformis TaxID=36881 RepID=A0AAE0BQA1_9CHLO|nr:hypothetical protein CYMTET_49395 [Cymbomonas tetramitiformis]
MDLSVSTSHSQSLVDLPDSAILGIMFCLEAEDLARFGTLNHRLKRISGDLRLWEYICLRLWPGCRVELYNGDWARLCRSRKALPAAFPKLKDRVSLQQASAGADGQSDLDQVAFEDVMHVVFSIGVLMARDERKNVARSLEYADYSQTFVELLKASPTCMVKFFRDTREIMDDYDFWGLGYVRWQDMPWRRSAIEFTMEIIRPGQLGPKLCGAQAALYGALTQDIDAAIRSAQEESADLMVAVPLGMPRSHWWYFLTPTFVGQRC